MLTRDPLTGQLRILAPERLKRLGPRPEGCPFCPGNEETTPPELARDTDEGAWSARAFPNLFPLAEPHEVIVLSNRHVDTTRALTLQEWTTVTSLALGRVRLHNSANTYAHLFVNDGAEAGASLEHVHAQLAVVPKSEETDRLTQHCLPDGCAACQLHDLGELSVWEREGMHLLAAPAPRTGGSLLLVPRQHDADLSRTGVDAFAGGMARAVAALEPGPFNCWLVFDPAREAHPYVEFVPRRSIPAGMELGLGLGVSMVAPEAAAQAARERVGAGSLSSEV